MLTWIILRGFKQLITQINFWDVKKTLLLAEIFQQTVWLILLEAYEIDDSDVTALIKHLTVLFNAH
jgi:hypothetical protein